MGVTVGEAVEVFVGTGVSVPVGDGDNVEVEVGVSVLSTITSMTVGEDVTVCVCVGSGCTVLVSVAVGVRVTGNISGVDSAGRKGISLEKAPGWNQPCIHAKPIVARKSRPKNRSHALTAPFFGFLLFFLVVEPISTRKGFWSSARVAATRFVTDSFENGRLAIVGTPTGNGGRGAFAFAGLISNAEFSAFINSEPV